MPATNVQFAAAAGFLALIIEHLCAAHGYTLPDDIRAGLPGFLALIVAHVCDLVTGDAKK